ncbi:MAG: hypothetical protein ABIG39_01785 [Candidatus Micrarchaeota archaeon]
MGVGTAAKTEVTGHLSFLAKTLFQQPVTGVADWLTNTAVSLIFVGLVGGAADTGVRLITTEKGTYENGGFSIGGAIRSDTEFGEHFGTSAQNAGEDVLTVYIGAGKLLGNLVIGAIKAFDDDPGTNDKGDKKDTDKKYRFGAAIQPAGDVPVMAKKNNMPSGMTLASLTKNDRTSNRMAVKHMRPNTKAPMRTHKTGNGARVFG